MIPVFPEIASMQRSGFVYLSTIVPACLPTYTYNYMVYVYLFLYIFISNDGSTFISFWERNSAFYPVLCMLSTLTTNFIVFVNFINFQDFVNFVNLVDLVFLLVFETDIHYHEY